MKELLRNLKNMESSKRKLAGTTGGSVVNGAVGVGKLLLGLYYQSDWLAVNALYYLALCMAKLHLIWRYRIMLDQGEVKEQAKKKQELFHRNGYFQLVLGVSYFFVSLHTLLVGNVVFYPAYIRYVMILIAFGKTGTAVMGLYRMRKSHDPVIAAVRVIDFTDAMVSMVVCRSVLQVMNHAVFAVESSGILGILCSLLFALIGVAMLRTKRLEGGEEADGGN